MPPAQSTAAAQSRRSCVSSNTPRLEEPWELSFHPALADPASGTSIDYLQSRGVPYIYAVELRPENSMEVLHGFIIPPDLIEPTGRELLAAVKAIAEYVVETRRL